MNLNNLEPGTWIIVAAILAATALVIVVLYMWRRARSKALQDRFGPEYARTVEQSGSRASAEHDLLAREKRVGQLNIVELSSVEAERFSQAWTALQLHFVDNPAGVVLQADQLVRELMLARGYPMGDFELRVADISVDHPTVVANYRAAQPIAVRASRGEADTEALRTAVVHYRALFDELLEVRQANAVSASPPVAA